MTRPDQRSFTLSRRAAALLACAPALVILAVGPALPKSEALGRPAAPSFEPVRPPEWVHGVTRMTFASPGEIDVVARSGAQVLHTNVVWPYYPLRRDGGGL